MSINVEAEKRAYKKFRQAGMTAAGACGLIGNLEAESDGFYTNRVEYLCLKRLKEKGKVYTHATYTAAIDSGKISCEEFLHPLSGKQYGYGLAQWTSPGREFCQAERRVHCGRRYAAGFLTEGTERKLQPGFGYSQISNNNPAGIRCCFKEV